MVLSDTIFTNIYRTTTIDVTKPSEGSQLGHEASTFQKSLMRAKNPIAVKTTKQAP